MTEKAGSVEPVKKEELEEEMAATEYRLRYLETIRLDQDAIIEMATTALKKQTDELVERLAVHKKEKIDLFLHSDVILSKFNRYIELEKNDCFRDVLSSSTGTELQAQWDILNRLVFVDQQDHSLVVGELADALNSAMTLSNIDHVIVENELRVTRTQLDGRIQTLYTRQPTEFFSWTPNGAVNLVEGSIIHERNKLTKLNWQRALIDTESGETDYMKYCEYVLRNEAWPVEHELCEYQRPNPVILNIYHNVLQRLSTVVLDDCSLISNTSPVGKMLSLEGKSIADAPNILVKVDNQIKMMNIEKLTMRQKVFIVQECIEDSEVKFVGNGLQLVKELVAGSVKVFDSIAFENTQKLDPSMAAVLVNGIQPPSVNLDW